MLVPNRLKFPALAGALWIAGCAAASGPLCPVDGVRRLALEVDGPAFELDVRGPGGELPRRIDLHLDAAEPLAVVQLGCADCGVSNAVVTAPTGIPQPDGSVVVARAARLDLQLAGTDVGARLRFVRLQPRPEPLRGEARVALVGACQAAPEVRARAL